ncbi:NB-ARC domain-containing protein [Allokutzneria oryzae]|uniref:NB-ARC domain-containing protein n=1 Tax=Allokutzneria oryzae TaxID=1378989 RepID=A0ABV5ZNI7_9PSEU
MLRGEHALLVPTAPERTTWWPICQLPADIGELVGRTSELRTITAHLAARDAVVLVSGPPGVGKTALAVHAAHRLEETFTDGQLYADLHGHAQQLAVPPTQVLSGFLRALGVAPEDLPSDEAGLSARYRSLVAGRRVLIVLDNAANSDQVRPLLPTSARCAVVVTSRNELRGLAASHSSHRLRMDVLSQDSALTLMTSLLERPERTEAMTTLVELCGGLPLAVRIAATNIACGNDTVESYVDKLRTVDWLSELAIDGDGEAALRTVFDLSYNALTPEAQHVFTALARAEATDFCAQEAANLTGVPIASVISALDRLADANLIQNSAPDSFHFPTLLRRYAADRLVAEHGGRG